MPRQVVEIDLIAKDKGTAVFKNHAAAVAHAREGYQSLSSFMNQEAEQAQKAASATDTLTKSTKNAGNAADGASGSFSTLFKSFTLGTLAASAIQRAAGATTDFIRDSIQASRDYNSALMGLSSAAASFGQNIEHVRNVAQSASSDGLVPLASNAAALRDLMQTGMNIEQATELLARFKDEAAFGRARTIEYGTAVENLAQAYKTEQSALGNLSGHSENFSVAMERGAATIGKTVAQLTAAERAQIKFTEYMRARNHTMGDAALYAETAAGKQAQLAQKTLETQVAVGNALSPAVAFLQQGFIDLVSSLGITEQGMQNAQANFLTLAMVVQQVVNVVVGGARLIYGSIASLMNLSLDPLKEQANAAGKAFFDTAQNWQEGIDRIANGTEETVKEATGGIVADNQAAMQKIQDQVDNANRQFERSMEQRAKQFQESIRDMVMAHRDKALSLKSDLAFEEAEYAKSSQKRKKAYLEEIEDLESRHAEKLADIQEQITDEKNSGYEVDGVLYREANAEKIARLEQSLQEEETKHRQALDKRKAQYDEDVAEDKERHERKMSQLQTELDAEIQVLNTHRAEVAAIGDAQKEDDITRLKRQHAEANALAERDHLERLAKIRTQGASQGSAYGGAYAGAVNGAMNNVNRDFEKRLNELKAISGQKGRESSQSLWENFKTGLFQWFRELPNTLRQVARSIDQHTGFFSGLSAVLKAIPNPSANYYGDVIKNLVGRADGGVVRPGETTLVGERGPEIAKFPAGTRIIPNHQLGGVGGGKSITIGTVINQSNMDPDAFFRALFWELR